MVQPIVTSMRWCPRLPCCAPCPPWAPPGPTPNVAAQPLTCRMLTCRGKESLLTVWPLVASQVSHAPLVSLLHKFALYTGPVQKSLPCAAEIVTPLRKQLRVTFYACTPFKQQRLLQRIVTQARSHSLFSFKATWLHGERYVQLCA